jgi:hypothetical protein
MDAGFKGAKSAKDAKNCEFVFGVLEITGVG